MAHNLIVTLFILAVYVAAVATPLVYATKSPTSTIAKEDEATKEGDAAAKAPEAATKGSAKDHKAEAKGDAPTTATDVATKGSAKDHKETLRGMRPPRRLKQPPRGMPRSPKQTLKGLLQKGPEHPCHGRMGGLSSSKWSSRTPS